MDRCVLVLLLAFLTSYGVMGATLICTKPKGPTCIIKSLPSDSDSTSLQFPDLSKRTVLRIAEGKLSNLTEQLAAKLPVRELWLQGLELKSAFVAANFEKLYLRNNKLETLLTQSDPSSVSSTALKVLDVSNNMLKNCTQLAPFHQLEELYLDENQLTELRMELFVKMTQLRILSAARNGIVQIVPPTSGLEMHELTTLSLAHNRLATLQMTSWELPSLQTLLLNNNSLTEVEGLDGFERFYELQKLELAGNRWSCGWLQHALEKVRVAAAHSSPDSDGVRLDRSVDDSAGCSIDKVHGICCSFTTAVAASSKPMELFLPEIDRVREAIVQIDRRHEALRAAQAEQLKHLSATLQNALDEYLAQVTQQEDESVQLKRRAASVHSKVDQLEKSFARLDSEATTAGEVEQQRKRLLHFMVDMINKLLQQAIETDRLWVQANGARIEHDRRMETSPTSTREE
uniref:Leucine-rich immune protein (Short) n=1 Tax=Anopheles epiroticus TaxID=199890 RepID=A0A182PQG9_9DIPT